MDVLDVAGPAYVLNRRGRKPSGALGPNYSMRTEIDDLDRVLDEIVAAEGAEHGVDLFGWSFGGLVALEAAARRTGSVHSLTLYEPVVRPFGRGALSAPLEVPRCVVGRLQRRSGWSRSSPRPFGALPNRSGFRPTCLDALRVAAAADDLDRALEIVNRDVSGFSEEDVAQLRRSAAWEVLRPLAAPLAQELTALDEHPADLRAFGALDLPVTLLLGAENEGVPPYGDVFAEIAAALPRARVVTMPGQGHLAHAQDPESLARHIGQALHRAERGDPDA